MKLALILSDIMVMEQSDNVMVNEARLQTVGLQG